MLFRSLTSGTVAPTSTLDHVSGGTIQGGATLDISGATISTFEGDIEPGSAGTVDTLTIDRTAGTLTLGAATALNIDIASGTSSDQFVVTGTIDVTSATLNIDATGAGLTGGETFTIVTATSVTGTFTIGTVIDHLAGFTASYVGGTVVLTAN